MSQFNFVTVESDAVVLQLEGEANIRLTCIDDLRRHLHTIQNHDWHYSSSVDYPLDETKDINVLAIAEMIRYL
jgi:hypothetical protein